jgi:hypothetical protein
MTDFEAALQQQLARNADLAQQRAAAEEEMDRALEERREAERQEAARQQQARFDRHAELAEHLGQVAAQLKAASPETFIVRTGWSESGEEYRAKLSTRRTSPARSLLVDLDRDDDQVMARWNSELGDTVELWRLLDVSTDMITQLVLQVADQSVWDRATSPPAFPVSA